MGWIARKSVEHQLRNTTYGVRKLVAAANVITAAWDADKGPTTEALAEFKRRKQKLAMDMLGIVGIVQLRRVLIEPEIDALYAHSDARSAVISLCDWTVKQVGDAPDRPAATFSDDEITAMVTQSRHGLVARLLGITD